MSEPSSPVAKKKPTKPVLSQTADELIEEQINLIENRKKIPSAKKIIATTKAEISTAAAQDAKDGNSLPAAVKKGVSAPVQDPAEFTYKLPAKEQNAFVSTLSKAEQSVLKAYPDVKANIDLLVNTIIPAPKKPLTAYFTFADAIRPKLRESDPDAPIAAIAKKIGEEWAALGDGQEKYAKIHEENQQEYAKQQEVYANLLLIQDKAVTFYMNKLKLPADKLDQVHPVKAADLAKENAKPKHGLPWEPCFPVSGMKKAMQSTPNWPKDKVVGTEVATLMQTVVESFVVWLGTQLAIKTVQTGKKTAVPPLLKLIALDEPQKNFMAYFPSIVNIAVPVKGAKAKAAASEDGDEEEEKKPKKTTKKAEVEDKKQTKLNLVAKSSANNMTDDDDDESEDDDVKPATPVKKAKKEPTEKKAKAVPSDQKKLNLVASTGNKQMNDDDESEEDRAAIAAATKAKKAPAEKKAKEPKNHVLAIPADAKIDDARLALLKKTKAEVQHISVFTSADGKDKEYVDNNTKENITDKALIKKYNQLVADIAALQADSNTTSASKKRKSNEGADKQTVKKQKTKKD